MGMAMKNPMNQTPAVVAVAARNVRTTLGTLTDSRTSPPRLRRPLNTSAADSAIITPSSNRGANIVDTSPNRWATSYRLENVWTIITDAITPSTRP